MRLKLDIEDDKIVLRVKDEGIFLKIQKTDGILFTWSSCPHGQEYRKILDHREMISLTEIRSLAGNEGIVIEIDNSNRLNFKRQTVNVCGHLITMPDAFIDAMIRMIKTVIS